MLFQILGNVYLMFAVMIAAGYFDRVMESRRERDLIVAAWAQQFQRRVSVAPNENRPSDVARALSQTATTDSF